MKIISQHFEPLEESQRLAYLYAMDIPVWVLRDESQQELITSDLIPESDDIQKDLTQEIEPKAELLDESQETSNIKFQSTEEISQYKGESSSLLEKSSSVKSLSDKVLPNCFLKMVNWRSKELADKTLLIICRHQVDQPAQSFAKANAPSQFMTDYIRAIDEMLSLHNIELQIQLAHLTEAGLGSDNQALPDTFQQVKPDLVLFLGDEAVKLILNTELDLAQFRGKLHQINLIESSDNITVKPQALVSYHPYTLIKNPSLKKLAMEDLNLLIKVLVNSGLALDRD